MKKISILSACILMCTTAFGQAQVVKDAENAMNKGEYFTEVVKIVTPAFSDPATANDAKTYYVPGMAGFKTYDEMLKLAALGQLPANGEKIRSEAILGGYDYLMKALPLDSVVNDKGKVKTKYSKEIVKTIGSNLNSFLNAGIDFWNNEDWENAYRVWNIYCTLPTDARFAKEIPMAPADSTLSEIMFNRSLAAYQTGDMKRTLNSFLEAKAKGYSKKALYDYAISAAYQAGENDIMISLCEEALPLFGSEDSRYIRQIINSYIEKKDYQQAIAMLDKAIAVDPNNADYYVIQGVLFEQDGVNGDSKSSFAKAVELNPNSTEALYNLGRTIYNEGVAANDAAPTDPEAYAKVKAETIIPILKEATKYLENAWEVDNDNHDALKLLYDCYYMIGDEANMNKTSERMKY